MMKKNFFKLLHSFKYAIKGIGYAILNEQNMRFHIVAAVYVLVFSSFYNFGILKYIVLLLTISSVMAAELLNTGIEAICDAVTKENNNYIKIAKDVSAGAVLITAISSVAVGIFLFWDISTFVKIINFFKGSIISLLAFILSIIVSVFFIFYDLPKKNNNKRSI